MNITAVLTGIGLLIFAYLLFSNGSAVVGILGTGGNVAVNETKTLQGR